MASPAKTYKTADGQEITCLEDLPSAARLLARQRLLAKWYWAASLLALIFSSRHFWATSGWLHWPLYFLVLFGLVGPVLFPFLLLCFLRCPVCQKRFALLKACPSCGLPTHRDPRKSLFPNFSPDS
jgi:hypothetical protein